MVPPEPVNRLTLRRTSTNSVFGLASSAGFKSAGMLSMIKDGKAIMTQPGVAFGQQAEFGLHPKIYVGLVSNVVESDVLTVQR